MPKCSSDNKPLQAALLPQKSSGVFALPPTFLCLIAVLLNIKNTCDVQSSAGNRNKCDGKDGDDYSWQCGGGLRTYRAPTSLHIIREVVLMFHMNTLTDVSLTHVCWLFLLKVKWNSLSPNCLTGDWKPLWCFYRWDCLLCHLQMMNSLWEWAVCLRRSYQPTHNASPRSIIGKNEYS